MFKFNFNPDPSSQPSPHPDPSPDLSPSPLIEPYAVPYQPSPALASLPHAVLTLGREPTTFLKSLATPSSSLAPPTTDILPAIYEGGFKLWECALDLTSHLLANPPSATTVLELGAGHAFPAIAAARAGATIIHIHDYNAEVLHAASMPNVDANAPDRANFRYFAGGWHALPAVLGRRYDLVLSAETVYAPQAVVAVATVVLDTLACGGTALIAGKAYYFGVGGGTRAFANAVVLLAERRAIAVTVDVVEESRDGASNVREIVRVRR